MSMWRALTRFCCSKACQSVSMRVFSQVAASSEQAEDLPSCPVCWRRPWRLLRVRGRLAAREIENSGCLRANPFCECRRGDVRWMWSCTSGPERASKLRSLRLSQPRLPPSHSSSAPHDRPQPSPNYHRTLASPTNLRQSTSPTNTVAVTMVCARRRQQPFDATPNAN